MLANGLEVIVIENHGVPLATVEMVVRNGSFTQSKDYSGLAHLYEHMFFKSNDDYPREDQFTARASELGAIFNASTHEEVVNYYLTVPADSLAGAMRFIESAFRAPHFDRDELERERQVVIGEYDRQESNPYFPLLQGMDSAMWGSERRAEEHDRRPRRDPHDDAGEDAGDPAPLLHPEQLGADHRRRRGSRLGVLPRARGLRRAAARRRSVREVSDPRLRAADEELGGDRRGSRSAPSPC